MLIVGEFPGVFFSGGNVFYGRSLCVIWGGGTMMY